MTLEERIKAIENCTRIDDIDYEKDSVNIAANLVASVASQALSIIQELQNKNKELTRLEVIDESGRVYVNNNCKMELSYQDEGRTLKIFLKKEELSNDK